MLDSARIGCGDLTLYTLARGEATAVSTRAPEPVELRGQHPPLLVEDPLLSCNRLPCQLVVVRVQSTSQDSTEL